MPEHLDRIAATSRVARKWRWAIALAMAMVTTLASAEPVVEVIPLHYRTAEEVIPILQPMLARDGAISGFRGQLVIRTTPENLAEMKRILASSPGLSAPVALTCSRITFKNAISFWHFSQD